MSENTDWAVKPWEWQKAPEWWIDRLRLYWGARRVVDPVLEAKRNAREG